MSQTLPARFFVDADLYESERSAVFGREWMILGRTSDLADTGGYIAEEIAGYPIFVAVDSDGIAWGYHNVCPHRAGPILLPGRGHTDRLECQYHGWCFSYQGELVVARDFGESADFDPTTQRLQAISMGHWGGLLWVSLAGDVPPLTEALGRMVDDCQDIAFDRLVHTEHASKLIKCNWKVFVDNYLESYHVSGTHKVLDEHFDMAAVSDYNDDHYTLQETRTRDGVRMRWFYRYPNVALQVLGSTLCWMQILPQGPGNTLVVLDHYAPPGTDDTPLRTLCARLLDEDQPLCELVQTNLQAGVHRQGHLSTRHESSLVWFKNKIVSALDVRAD